MLPKYIAEYRHPDNVVLEDNMFVVDLTDPVSIARIIKHHINNFDRFMERFFLRYEKGKSSMVVYGEVSENGKFTPISETGKYEGRYDEEIFANAAVSYPELLHQISEYSRLMIAASEVETDGGPWATRDTILGQFFIPALANADKEYLSLFKRFILGNMEIRDQPSFHDYFYRKWEDACKKWNVDPESVIVEFVEIEDF